MFNKALQEFFAQRKSIPTPGMGNINLPQVAPYAPWENTVSSGQSLTEGNIGRLPQEIQGQARVYNANPQDPRVQGVDPAIFGYKADDTPQRQGIRTPGMGTIQIPGLLDLFKRR